MLPLQPYGWGVSLDHQGHRCGGTCGFLQRPRGGLTTFEEIKAVVRGAGSTCDVIVDLPRKQAGSVFAVNGEMVSGVCGIWHQPRSSALEKRSGGGNCRISVMRRAMSDPVFFSHSSICSLGVCNRRPYCHVHEPRRVYVNYIYRSLVKGGEM